MSKIAVLSNAVFTNTGYGTQSRVMLPRFMTLLGHEVANVAYYGVEGGVLTWGPGIKIYPKAYHPYGSDILDTDAQHFGADVAIAFLDSWVVEPTMVRVTPLAFYYPVDHEPLPRAVYNKVSQGAFRINYSLFGKRMTENAGLDTYYVPHCVDTQVYKPKPQGVARARVEAQTADDRVVQLPQDRFIVGMVAANKGNPSRKCFQQQLEAFKALHAKHPDTLMYIHTCRGQEQSGVNLPELVEYLGLTDSVLWAHQYFYHLGLPDAYMNDVYNSFDVLTNVAMGEGFGLPILEAQAAGTPVITGDWTAMSEITFAGWQIDRADADAFWTPLASYQFVPRVGAIVDAYEEAYKGAGNARLHSQARKGAIAYDADKVVTEQWKPVLDDMLARIQERKEARRLLSGAPAEAVA